MATDVELCSQAALKLGRNTFSDFNDGSREGEVFGPLYQQIIAEELGGEHWNFNIFVYKLSLDASTPIDGNWDYQYVIPPSPVAYIKVMDISGNGMDWEERTGLIFTNEAEAWVKYRRNLAEDSFPEYFQAVIIWRLALDAAEALAADANTIERAERNYGRVLQRAKRVDGMNNPPTQLYGNQSPWDQAHGGGGFQVTGWKAFSA